MFSRASSYQGAIGRFVENRRRKIIMKIAGIVIGILLILLGIIVGIVSLLLPSMTNNRVDFGEAVIGLVAGVLLFLLGFVIAAGAGVLYIKGRKKAAPEN